jgi:hypothetical protein
VRAEFMALPEGVTVVDGALEIRGPVVPGTTSLRWGYELGAEPVLETEVRVLSPVEELSIYVQDFGVAIDAGALHPARPARQDDVFYQLFVGFELEPGEVYPLRVTPLPPLASPPPALVAVVVMLLAGAGLFFVGRPVAEVVTADRGPSAEIEGEGDLEKEALRAALRDLEFDYEMGKLSDEDRDRLREELQRDAVRALARRRQQQAPTAPEPRLCECGRAAQPDDRFCAACGKAL